MSRIVATIVSFLALAALTACTSTSHPIGPSGSATVPLPTTTRSGSNVLPAGAQNISLTVGGTRRTAVVVRPSAGAHHRAMVLFLHGAGGNGAQVRSDLRIGDMARQAGVLMVYPDGSANHSWRSGCCNTFTRSNADFLFIAALIHTFVSDGEADPAHVVVAGFSAGALFTNSFACRYPQLLRGAVAVAGGLLEPPGFLTDVAGSPSRCAPQRPVTMLAVHGTADTTVPIAGTTQACGSDCAPGAAGFLPSAATVDGWWRRLDACGTAATRQAGDARISFAQCGGGTQVGLAIVSGPGHDLPQLDAAFPLRQTLLQLALGKPLNAW